MNTDIRPYSSPNPIDTLAERQPYMSYLIPISLYRTAEILACLQTLEDALSEASGLSHRRWAAADTWRELAGDIVAALPVETINLKFENRVDPFRAVKKDFPASRNPHSFRSNLPSLLKHMAIAAKHTAVGAQRYTDNYHGVICFQLMHHSLVTEEQCATFHRDVIRLPMPEACDYTGIVYRPDYVPGHLPRGSRQRI